MKGRKKNFSLENSKRATGDAKTVEEVLLFFYSETKCKPKKKVMARDFFFIFESFVFGTATIF